jgi:hypothetical protein
MQRPHCSAAGPLALFSRLAVASVAVAVVALTGRAGFLGVMLIVLRERAVQVYFRLKLPVFTPAHVALITGLGLNFFAFAGHINQGQPGYNGLAQVFTYK